MRFYEKSLVEHLRGKHRNDILQMRLGDRRGWFVNEPDPHAEILRKTMPPWFSSDFAERMWRAENTPGKCNDRALLCMVDGEPAGLAIYGLRRGKPYNVGFYVEDNYRRRGIGRKMYEKARQKWGKLKAMRWSSEATGFFDAVGAERVYWR